ncbi:hypothetical protein GCM10010431_73280 [Streptomyces kunmingensis]
MLVFAGRVALVADSRIVGAVGVGVGRGSREQDTAVAEAAVACLADVAAGQNAP